MLVFTTVTFVTSVTVVTRKSLIDFLQIRVDIFPALTTALVTAASSEERKCKNSIVFLVMKRTLCECLLQYPPQAY